ncbi:MAG: patatin-like phospholipase family protein [Firmicutes bacterium]|nr:patatin-like phospholipase family protein [Bacillota bacterium]
MNVTLALSGGSLKGAVHVGVLKALEEKGHKVGAVAGVSAGSVVGALYASGTTVSEIEKAFLGLKKPSDLYDFAYGHYLANIFRPWRLQGLIKGDRLEGLIRRNLKCRLFEETPIPLVIVVVDLRTGQRLAITSGDIATAVRASSAIPGVFFPKVVGQKILFDGSLAEPLPIDALHELPRKDMKRGGSSTITIAVDVLDTDPDPASPPKWLIDYASAGIDMLLQTITDLRLSDERRVTLLKPPTGRVGLFDFDRIPDLIELGYRTTKKVLG